MVSCLPSRIDNGSFSYLHNAITWNKASASSGLDQFNVSPLIPVVMNIVCNFAQKDAFGPQYSVGFLEKRRKGV
jgi:hypothetical protein